MLAAVMHKPIINVCWARRSCDALTQILCYSSQVARSQPKEDETVPSEIRLFCAFGIDGNDREVISFRGDGSSDARSKRETVSVILGRARLRLREGLALTIIISFNDSDPLMTP